MRFKYVFVKMSLVILSLFKLFVYIYSNNLRRGNYSYHIDHIIPKQYGFKHQIQPMIICHYKNLQMLWWKKNEIKSNKLFYNSSQINDILNSIKLELEQNNYYQKEKR